MKVLILVDPKLPISRYNSLGGAIQVACQISKELSKMGLEVVLGANWDDTNTDLTNYVTPFNISEGSNSRFYMKKAFNIINNHLETNHYDSINVHIGMSSIPKYLLKLNSKDTPVYFSMHQWSGLRSIFYYKNEYSELVKSDKVKFIFLCKSQMEKFFSQVGLSPKNYIIEPNAVLSEKYNITNKDAENYVSSMVPDKFMKEGFFLSVCRLVPSKHPAALVDVAKYTNHNLVIIGSKWISDTEYADNIYKEVETTDNVLIIDKLSNLEVSKFMKVAKCTVLYTDVEVCNLTVLESCIVGTPIIFGPSGSGVKDTLDILRGDGVYPIEFPRKSKWEVKRDYLSKLIDKASSSKYDISRFPECYKWDTHIRRYYDILTNSVSFN